MTAFGAWCCWVQPWATIRLRASASAPCRRFEEVVWFTLVYSKLTTLRVLRTLCDGRPPPSPSRKSNHRVGSRAWTRGVGRLPCSAEASGGRERAPRTPAGASPAPPSVVASLRPLAASHKVRKTHSCLGLRHRRQPEQSTSGYACVSLPFGSVRSNLGKFSQDLNFNSLTRRCASDLNPPGFPRCTHHLACYRRYLLCVVHEGSCAVCFGDAHGSCRRQRSSYHQVSSSTLQKES